MNESVNAGNYDMRSEQLLQGTGSKVESTSSTAQTGPYGHTTSNPSIAAAVPLHRCGQPTYVIRSAIATLSYQILLHKQENALAVAVRLACARSLTGVLHDGSHDHECKFSKMELAEVC